MEYSIPENFIKRSEFAFFAEKEKELVLAFQAFNKVVCHKTKGATIKKVVSAEMFGIIISEPDNDNNLLTFYFNERSFFGLMRRYKSPAEIRKMILNIFTIKD